MAELDSAIARLRLLLTEIAAKEEQLKILTRQFRTQMVRAPQQALYARASLDVCLAAMGEIEERLAAVEATRKRLQAIKQRAQGELEALQLTHKIETAKRTLAARLDEARATPSPPPDLLQEIQALEQFIDESSQRAGRAITEIAQERASISGGG